MELAQSSSNEKSYYKILDGSKVMLSDKEGTVNQGVLAEYYILKKEIKLFLSSIIFSILPHFPPRGGFLYTVFQLGTLANLIHPPRRQKKIRAAGTRLSSAHGCYKNFASLFCPRCFGHKRFPAFLTGCRFGRPAATGVFFIFPGMPRFHSTYFTDNHQGTAQKTKPVNHLIHRL